MGLFSDCSTSAAEPSASALGERAAPAARAAARDCRTRARLGQIEIQRQRPVEEAGEFRIVEPCPPAREVARGGLAVRRRGRDEPRDFYLSPAHRDTRTSGCPLPFLSDDAPRLPAASRDAYAAGVERLTARIAEQLSLMNHPDPRSTASSALSELVGALALARADQRLASPRPP